MADSPQCFCFEQDDVAQVWKQWQMLSMFNVYH